MPRLPAPTATVMPGRMNFATGKPASASRVAAAASPKVDPSNFCFRRKNLKSFMSVSYIYGDDFVVKNRGDGDGKVGATVFSMRSFVGDEQMNFFGPDAFGQADPDVLRAHRNKFTERAFHGHRIGQINQVYDQGVAIAPGGHVQHAGAGDFHHLTLVGRRII